MKAALLLSVIASTAIGLVAGAEEELKVDVTTRVNCERKTKKGDKVAMHYRGTLASNGKQFDASYDRGQPLTFKVGSGQVIKGWDQGLLDMCIGEKRTLTIPPSFGYGDRGVGPIPGGATLIFETELVGIVGVPKPDPIDYVKETESESEPAEKVAESSTGGVAEKVGSVVSEATDAAKTILADTDDTAHEEL